MGQRIRTKQTTSLSAAGVRSQRDPQTSRGLRLALGALLGAAVVLSAARPAAAQEVSPPPTPSPTPTPAPSPSPSPSPTVAPVPRPAPDRTADRQRERKRRPSKKRKAVDRRRGGRPSKPTAIRVGCGPFSWTQTYGSWGPARSYGTMVTVVYEASRCVKPTGPAALELSVQGTATVHAGDTTLDAPIDSRPFTVTGMWDRPTNPDGWPPAWWQCSVKQAHYTWQIPDVYTFDVAARWGVWTLKVTTGGEEASVLTWAYNACQSRLPS